MSKHLIVRNSPTGPEVLCTVAEGGNDSPRCHRWRSLEVSHALGHPTAFVYKSQADAWAAADKYTNGEGIAVNADEYPKPEMIGVKGLVAAKPPVAALRLV